MYLKSKQEKLPVSKRRRLRIITIKMNNNPNARFDLNVTVPGGALVSWLAAVSL